MMKATFSLMSHSLFFIFLLPPSSHFLSLVPPFFLSSRSRVSKCSSFASWYIFTKASTQVNTHTHTDRCASTRGAFSDEAALIGFHGRHGNENWLATGRQKARERLKDEHTTVWWRGQKSSFHTHAHTKAHPDAHKHRQTDTLAGYRCQRCYSITTHCARMVITGCNQLNSQWR